MVERALHAPSLELAQAAPFIALRARLLAADDRVVEAQAHVEYLARQAPDALSAETLAAVPRDPVAAVWPAGACGIGEGLSGARLVLEQPDYSILVFEDTDMPRRLRGRSSVCGARGRAGLVGGRAKRHRLAGLELPMQRCFTYGFEFFDRVPQRIR